MCNAPVSEHTRHGSIENRQQQSLFASTCRMQVLTTTAKESDYTSCSKNYSSHICLYCVTVYALIAALRYRSLLVFQ